MEFLVDDDGDMVYTSKVPIQGTIRIKCLDGGGLDLSMLGTKMSYHMKWVNDGTQHSVRNNSAREHSDVPARTIWRACARSGA